MHKIPKQSLWLPDIRSGWNTGAFFRTCDSLGVDHIFLSGYTPFPPHKEISKTALDADTFVPWTYFSNTQTALQFFKEHQIDLYAMELTPDSKQLDEAHWSSTHTCLVVGNEITGVSDEILSESKEVLYIPMHGKKQSMNVSIAGSIGLWEMQKNAPAKL